MRRLSYLLLLVLFVSISATCVNASTDCERWFAAYRAELAHSRSLQRIAAAKRRAKLYANRKIAQIQPKPKLVLAKGPRMTRKQTLHHFNLACGVLPEDAVDEPVIAEEPTSPFIEHPLNDGIDLLPAGFGDMIAENDVPPPPFAEGGSPGGSSGGGPPIYTPPYTGGITSPGGGTPGTGTTVPPTGPVTPPATPEVPEPATFVLLLTGMAGAAGAFRQRFKA
jgi:PEP-CTERM motif